MKSKISNTSDPPETSDDYLPASPEENLLAQEQAAIDTSRFDISLNPEQQRHWIGI